MSKPQKLPSGMWRVRWLDDTGKRRSETFRTHDAARAALRRHELEVDEIRAGRAQPRSDQRVRDVATEWLDSREPAPGCPATLAVAMSRPKKIPWVPAAADWCANATRTTRALAPNPKRERPFKIETKKHVGVVPGVLVPVLSFCSWIALTC